MQRRAFLIGLAAGTVVQVGMALADNDPAQAVIARLRAEGFRDIAAARTFIGRVRITAHKGGATREVVVDPRTGEILRDLTRASQTAQDDASSETGSGSGPSGSDDGSSGDAGSEDGGSDDGGSDGHGSGDGGSGGGSDSDGSDSGDSEGGDYDGDDSGGDGDDN